MANGSKIDDYDLEPVKYCARCYSLKIKYEDSVDSECCAECGSSDVLETSIKEWEEMYARRYGHRYVTKEEDPRKTFIFNMTLEELKTKINKSEKWKDIIYKMYPRFPKGLSKADSIILFFDTIIKHDRVDELKILLSKIFKY